MLQVTCKYKSFPYCSFCFHYIAPTYFSSHCQPHLSFC
uniref:Uncharacterized protein n=1 Tax=Arundo donax TaxID=35708 RepID=A0A0A9HLM8_ARUDO